jgi:hypothetical protein
MDPDIIKLMNDYAATHPGEPGKDNKIGTMAIIDKEKAKLS